MKRSYRAVSPIIATILLVAITVVLAALLYVIISELSAGPLSPYSRPGSVSYNVTAYPGVPVQIGLGEPAAHQAWVNWSASGNVTIVLTDSAYHGDAAIFAASASNGSFHYSEDHINPSTIEAAIYAGAATNVSLSEAWR